MKKFLSGILATIMVATSMVTVSMAAEQQTAFTVEAEDIACSGGMIKANGSYGGIANASGDEVLVFDYAYSSSLYTATVNAAAPGMYSVNVIANAADGSASDMSFAINGRSIDLTTASTKTAIEGSKGANGWQLYRFDSAGVVYLAEGDNTLSIYVGKRPGYEAYALATLDALEFVPSENSGLMVSAQGSSTIEAEKAIKVQYGKISANDSASGKNIVYYDTGIGAANQNANIYAEKAGIYKMSMVAGANGASDTYSSVTVSVNGGAAKTLAAADIDASFAGFNGYAGLPMRSFNVSDIIYLNEGLNTIAITIGPRPGASSSVLAAFDSFTFEPSDALNVSASGTSVIEAEKAIKVQYGKISANDSASGKSIVYYDTGIAAANQTADIFVEQAGLYKMSMVAGANGASDTYSSVTVSVNGGTAKTLVAADIDAGFVGFNGYAGLPMRNFNVSDSIYLEEGLNTIAITMGPRPGAATSVLAAFDSFTFEPSNALTVSASGTSVIEAEKAIKVQYGKISANDSASGKSIVYYDTGIAAANQTADIFVEQAGFYKMSMVTGANGASSTYSTVTFSLNGGAVRTLAAADIDANFAGFNGYAGLPMKNFVVSNLVYLEEGLNTIAITMGPRPGAATSVLAAFDSFTFEAYEVAMVGETAGAVEVEEYNWKHTRTVDGRTSVAFYDAGYASYVVEAAVKADVAGDYDMSIEAAVNDGTSTVLADLVVDINNTSISVNNTNFSATDLGYNYWDAAFKAKNFKNKDTVYLNEGINMIKLTITPNAARGSILGAIDKIVFAPVCQITDATISVDSVMTKGAEKNVSIKDQDGNAISNSDVYMITYNTSDDDVVIVDGNGKLSAVGFGTATVSVAVKVGEEATEIVKTAEVVVVGDEGIYIDNVQNSNGTVSFDFVATKDYAATQVYVASFEGETLVSAVALVDIEAGVAGTTPKSATLTGYEEGQAVYVFVWQDTKPVWSKVNVK